MPGRFYLTSELALLADALTASCDMPEPGPRLDAAPGEEVAVLTSGPRQLVSMRWSMIMGGRRNARGRPVMETIVNARSETVLEKSAFAGVQRCVLPVNGWYEWTGEARRKTRWRISAPAQPILCFAAVFDVWKGPGGIELAQMATVTCAPNSDVSDYHHRMPVILDEAAMQIWLGETDGALQDVLSPAPLGLLKVEETQEP